MLKRRIIFTIWCLFILLYLFFRADIVSVCLFVFTVLVTAVTAICAYITAKKMSVSIKIDGEDIDCGIANLEITSDSYLPVFNGMASLKYKNIKDDDAQTLDVCFYLGIKDKNNIELELKSEHDAEISVRLDEIKVMDIFGVIAFNIIPESDNEVIIVVSKQEEATDEQGFVSDSEETKTEHKEEISTEQVQE